MFARKKRVKIQRSVCSGWIQNPIVTKHFDHFLVKGWIWNWRGWCSSPHGTLAKYLFSHCGWPGSLQQQRYSCDCYRFFCCMLCELNTKLFKRVFTWLFFFSTFCNHSRCAWHMLVSKILFFLTQLPVCSQHGPCKVNERKEFDVWVTHPLTNRFCVIKSFENNTIT